LSATLVSGPGHGSVSLNSNGGFSYTPAGGFVGSDSFSYTASDGTNSSAPATVAVSVTDQAPVLTSPGNQSNIEGDTVSLPVTASDPNPGDTVTVTASGLPPGLAINASAVITGTVNSGDAANSPYSVTLTATDNHGAASSATLSWTVTTTSTSPVVGLWHMDETSGNTMSDASGNGHNGTLTDIALSQPGWLGTAFGFNGSSSHAVVPNTSSLNPGSANFSFQVHLRFSAVPAHDYDIFRKGLSTSSGGDFKMEIFTTSAGAEGSCVARGSATRAGVTAGPNLADGQWHTLSCVKTSTSLSLIVDGVIYSEQRSIGSVTNSDDLWFGAQAGADYYNGIMDEVSYRIGG
jgi:hypothetical protein